MKLNNSLFKAMPRVAALVFFFLTQTVLKAQDTTYKNNSRTSSGGAGQWYDQGWIWFVIIIIAIILILALGRKSGKNITDRDQNKFKDRR